jgi:predicted phosphodiesterase
VRYGVLADVHGNLDALRAALRALEREGVDGFLVAGDLVGYGQ